jgi:aryl-alcohol dehydrogenase-like predicted oxidoreductase
VDLLPYTSEHEVGVLAYGPLAHGLLGGHLDERSTFAADDWRSANPSFTGDAFLRNVEVVRELGRFAAEELACSVAQLAVAWVLANPAVDAAIVGVLDPWQIDEAVAAAADIQLSTSQLTRIDAIMRNAVAFRGPSPDQMPKR